MRIDAFRSDFIRFLNRFVLAIDGCTSPAETKQPAITSARPPRQSGTLVKPGEKGDR